MSTLIQSNQALSLTLNQATLTLNAVDSGKLIMLGAQGQALAITLPPFVGNAGSHYTIVNQVGAIAHNVSITGGAGAFGGLLINAGGNPASAAGTTLTFISGISLAGDSIDLYCDGSGWSVRAYGAAAGAITII